VFTGRISPEIYSYIRRALRRLGVEDKVVFTGFVSREKRFEIVAKAKLMLYPSHVDSYLGTPVVGYRIPALEIYYSKCPGVELVEEGDVEALTVKAINVLEKGEDAVEPPKIKSWKEVISEEIDKEAHFVTYYNNNRMVVCSYRCARKYVVTIKFVYFW
jgi:glycosyltransferase involved in cell wall biosynthesis